MLSNLTRLNRSEKMDEYQADCHRAQFEKGINDVYQAHLSQTPQTVKALQAKYAFPSIGNKFIDEHLAALGTIIDPSDPQLWCVSQLTHSLQVAEMMESDGLPDELVLAGLLHDIGKLLLDHGELPENVVCPNEVIAYEAPSKGLENAICHWGHDEFAYQRLKSHVSEDIAWLIRYHSLRFETAEEVMCSKDKDRHYHLLEPFRHYDLCSKSIHFKPRKTLKHYRDLLRGFIPLRVAL